MISAWSQHDRHTTAGPIGKVRLANGGCSSATCGVHADGGRSSAAHKVQAQFSRTRSSCFANKYTLISASHRVSALQQSIGQLDLQASLQVLIQPQIFGPPPISSYPLASISSIRFLESYLVERHDVLRMRYAQYVFLGVG
jgi:hypothetical protein